MNTNYKEYEHNTGYLVYDDGRIYSKPNKGNRGIGRFLKPFINKKGYAKVKLYPECKTVSVHRMIAETFIANPNDLPQVNHKDGCKTNNCVNNLEWCTNAENFNHANDTGLINEKTRPRGIEHGRAKLTELEVIHIRTICIKGDTSFGVRALAKRYDLDPSTISSIVNGDYWKHLL